LLLTFLKTKENKRKSAISEDIFIFWSLAVYFLTFSDFDFI